MLTSGEHVTFELVDDMTGDGLVTLMVRAPFGVFVMAEPTTIGRMMTAPGVHMHAAGIEPNGVGPSALRAVVDAFLKELDLDGLVLEGAVRTTGANPGARPRPVRFTRRPGAPSRSGAS